MKTILITLALITISARVEARTMEARTMQVEATAYCSCYKCCGKHLGDAGYGITRSGTQVRPGVVAVDPRVIPLGSRVRIQGKIFWAEDTGGAIKGRRIDIYCTTHKAALEWGRREIEIEILGKGKGK